MRRAIAVCALCLVVAVPALAGPKKAGVTWHTDLDAARQESWERGVPLLIFFSRFT